MNKRIIETTTKRVNALLETLRSMPTEPVGDHLSEEEFIAYAVGEATAEKLERTDAHLASCGDCAARMEGLLETARLWEGPQGKQRLTALQQEARISAIRLERERLAAQLATVVLLTGAALRRARAVTALVEDKELADGTLGWRIEEDEAANLRIYIDSPMMELEGSQLRLQAGAWHEDVVLSKVASNYVGGEATIFKSDRAAKIREEDALRCVIIGEAPEADNNA